jgi:ABC-type dipeptide/oligopeptide/nickel transport system permease subunit
MSFLGIGVEAPQASWGSMLREGQEMMSHSPRLVLIPGLLIMATVFGFNLLGEGLRDALDPKD